MARLLQIMLAKKLLWINIQNFDVSVKTNPKIVRNRKAAKTSPSKIWIGRFQPSQLLPSAILYKIY